MSETIFYINDKWLLKRLDKRYHTKEFIEGACFGLSHMIAQAILARDLQTFVHRLKFLYRSNDQQINQKLTALYAKISLMIKEAQAEFASLSSELNLTELIAHKFESLSEGEKTLLGIFPFMDGIAIYQSLGLFPFLYPPRMKKFSTQNPEFLCELIGSLKIENGESSLKPIHDHYDHASFLTYLGKLRKAIDINQNPGRKKRVQATNLSNFGSPDAFYAAGVSDNSIPVAIMFSNDEHITTITYDSKEKKWILPTMIPFLTYANDEDFANALLQEFGQRKAAHFIFRTEFLVRKEHQKFLQARMDSMQLSPTKLSCYYDKNNKDGSNLLDVAAYYNDEALLDKLLAANININQQNLSGETALYSACRFNYVNIIKKLIFAGANPNIVTKHGKTALMEAVSNGNSEICKLLIKHGAAINCASSNGHTPLIRAAKLGFTNIVAMLLAKDADVFSVDTSGFDALTYARRNNHLAIVRQLEKIILNKTEAVPLFQQKQIMQAIHSNSRMKLKSILRRQSNLNFIAYNHDTPLIEMIKHGSLQNIKYLLAKGADPNLANHAGVTPVFAAVARADAAKIMRLLFRYGANASLRGTSGETLLHLAVAAQNVSLAKTILEQPEVNANKKSWTGLTPLHLATAANNFELVKLLLKNHADPNQALNIALIKNHVKIALLLLDNHANPNCTDNNEAAPLHLALKYLTDPSEVVKKLLEAGANPNSIYNQRDVYTHIIDKQRKHPTHALSKTKNLITSAKTSTFFKPTISTRPIEQHLAYNTSQLPSS